MADNHTFDFALEFVPDLFLMLEFTILFMSTRISLHNDLRSTPSTIAPDATVHVLIMTCGEYPDVVLKTVKAAASRSYPEQSYQVFVLDHARNDNVRQAIEQFDQNPRVKSPGKLPVVYLSCKKTTTSTHYESGNIRFGLSKALESHSSSRHIAVLDSNMVPSQIQLAHTVPPLETDRRLSTAGPPQQFHNVPPGDILGRTTTHGL